MLVTGSWQGKRQALSRDLIENRDIIVAEDKSISLEELKRKESRLERNFFILTVHLLQHFIFLFLISGGEPLSA